MNIVPMLPMHIDGMTALEQVCFSMPWSRAMLMDELQNEFATYFVAEDETGAVTGYCGMHAIIDEGYITNLAVHPNHRRNGLADALLARIERTAEQYGLQRLTLEVRVSNEPARALYCKRGFTEVGLRRGYYSLPDEDGLIMEKVLPNTAK